MFTFVCLTEFVQQNDNSQSPLTRGGIAAPPRTLIDILRATAEAHPEAAAIDAGSGVLSYTELLDAVEAQAAELRAAGVRPGDKVGR